MLRRLVVSGIQRTTQCQEDPSPSNRHVDLYRKPGKGDNAALRDQQWTDGQGSVVVHEQNSGNYRGGLKKSFSYLGDIMH